MVQRWMAEGVEKDETGEWVLFADHELEVTAQAVVDGIVRNRLAEALREALDEWARWHNSYDYMTPRIAAEIKATSARIAELRKLLEQQWYECECDPPGFFDDPEVVARGKAILEEAGRKLAEAVDRDYDERRKEGS